MTFTLRFMDTDGAARDINNPVIVSEFPVPADRPLLRKGELVRLPEDPEASWRSGGVHWCFEDLDAPSVLFLVSRDPRAPRDR